MTKNKDQKLLKFPSAFNVEPGGKGDVQPVEEGGSKPEWKKVVSQKVQEHKKLKELQESQQQLLEIEQQGPSSTPGPAGEAAALSSKTPRSPKDLPQHPSRAPRLGPAPPADPALREKLVSAHQQMFPDEDLTKGTSPSLSKPTQPRPAPVAPPKSPASFAEQLLDKNPLPSPTFSTPLTTEKGDDEVSPDDYTLPLGEIIDRVEKATPPEPPEVVSPQQAPVQAPTRKPDRTILLSRFLAGLIDFIISLLTSVVMLGAVAWQTHAEMFTYRMGWLLVGLYLLIHMAFNFLFLFLLGQTIGMRLVGLQIIFHDGPRLTFKAALVRNVAFILSVSCAGLGLIWGLFDREAKCWHDILSDSQIIRTR